MSHASPCPASFAQFYNESEANKYHGKIQATMTNCALELLNMLALVLLDGHPDHDCSGSVLGGGYLVLGCAVLLLPPQRAANGTKSLLVSASMTAWKMQATT